MNPMKTLRVTGQGNLRLRPDLTRLTVILRGTEAEYVDALDRSERDTRVLKDALEPLGFEPMDLKTLSFDVETKYESVEDERGRYRQQFAGYEFTHVLKLEFPSNNERLGEALYALAHSEVSPELQISHTVRDPEAAKNALLDKAVQDAVDKAEILAAAAKVKLGEIRHIDYSRRELAFETQPLRRVMLADAAAKSAESYALDITPDDISASDTVTIVWEIK